MNIVVHLPTVEREFQEVMSCVQNAEWFRKHGYQLVLPSQKEFSNPQDFRYDELQHIFTTQEFDSLFYERRVKEIEGSVKEIEPVLYRFIDLHKQWGFKIFTTYDIFITKYGPGGSYDHQTGVITIQVPNKKSTKENSTHTIIHELIHIGIQEPIVEVYNLTHEEKERVVDLLCVYIFGDVLIDYKEQNVKTAIDEYLPATCSNDVLHCVAQYISDYPR